jgi:hypothetical protein
MFIIEDLVALINVCDTNVEFFQFLLTHPHEIIKMLEIHKPEFKNNIPLIIKRRDAQYLYFKYKLCDSLPWSEIDNFNKLPDSDIIDTFKHSVSLELKHIDDIKKKYRSHVQNLEYNSFHNTENSTENNKYESCAQLIDAIKNNCTISFIEEQLFANNFYITPIILCKTNNNVSIRYRFGYDHVFNTTDNIDQFKTIVTDIFSLHKKSDNFKYTYEYMYFTNIKTINEGIALLKLTKNTSELLRLILANPIKYLSIIEHCASNANVNINITRNIDESMIITYNNQKFEDNKGSDIDVIELFTQYAEYYLKFPTQLNNNQPITTNNNQPITTNNNQPITTNNNQPITTNNNQPITTNNIANAANVINDSDNVINVATDIANLSCDKFNVERVLSDVFIWAFKFICNDKNKDDVLYTVSLNLLKSLLDHAV